MSTDGQDACASGERPAPVQCTEPCTGATSSARSHEDECYSTRAPLLEDEQNRMGGASDELYYLMKRICDIENRLNRAVAKLADHNQRLNNIEMGSCDGTLIWKIKQFSQKCEEATRNPGNPGNPGSCLLSPHFFTSRAGYKMCVGLYPNGDGVGRGTHISLFFVVTRGQYDAILPWPFRQKVTFMLLDQNNREHVIDAFRPDPTSSSFRRPQSDMNIAHGVALFCPISELNRNIIFKEEDTIFIKIIVDINIETN